jgi:putative transposase
MTVVRRGRKLRRASYEMTQLEMKGIADAPLVKRSPGGKRQGAGRKLAAGKRRSVPHRKRAAHDGRHPVLVTLRARRGLPSLRTQLVSEMLQRVLREQRRRYYAGSFQVAEFTIQDNHLHLIVEATGLAVNRGADAPDALRAGVSGLVIAFAKQLNKLLRRKGKVWADRWHGRELGSPTELRGALVYVLRNAARHGAYFLGDGCVDPFSSAPRFTGWTRAIKSFSIETEPWPAALRPMTWMLGTGWRLIGLLDPNEARRRGE